VSAPIYSRQALIESRELEEQQAGAPSQLSIFDQVPEDAPMPDGLVLGYWADWLGEYVSRDKYLTSCPISRVRDLRVASVEAPISKPFTPRSSVALKSGLLPGFPK